VSLPRGFAAMLVGVVFAHGAFGCTVQSDPDSVTDPVSYVDPFIGTANGGNTFPGAVVPFGMVQFSPETTRGDATRRPAP